jgi:NADH:ubiquinone oxidoreductase subunit 2 (subunit N)
MSAALKYLLLSAFTTTLFLFSLALLYGIYGTVNIEYLRFLSHFQDLNNWPIL